MTFVISTKKIWEKNDLPMDSYYTGCLYTYMRWLKLYVLHKDSGMTKHQQLKIIRESFCDNMWNEGFRKADIRMLNLQYKVLKVLYSIKSAIGIRKICIISEGRKEQQ